MRFSSAASSAALFSAATLFLSAEATDVVSLTADNFLSVVNKESLMLVEFFAPWCGHCKALAPQYDEAATVLKDKGISLANVDCVDQADLCQEHGVQGYPTLKVFRNGESAPYTGPRKADGIISYMTKQALPAVTSVTAENITEFQGADKLVAIAYLSSPADAPGPEFTAAAEKHRDDYLFGYSADPEAAKAAGVTPPALLLYRKFDESPITYSGDAASVNSEQIADFIKENSIPLIDEVGADNYQAYAQSGLPLAYLFIEPSDERKQQFIDGIKPVAAKYKGKLNFVWIDASKFGDHAKALNVRESRWPAFVVQDLTKQLKYPMDQSKEVSAETVEEWVDQYSAGKLEPSLKSEAVPETQDEPVYVVVGKNFDDVVFDDSKDVFVEFYAPWCGHCKRLKPTWDSLAEKYEAVKDRLVIAKMDATENDLPPSVPFQISGFPTLKFKKAGSRDFIDYNGDRSLESLIEFLEENASGSLTPKEPAAAEPSSSATTETTEATETPVVEESHEHDEL